MAEQAFGSYGGTGMGAGNPAGSRPLNSPGWGPVASQSGSSGAKGRSGGGPWASQSRMTGGKLPYNFGKKKKGNSR